MIRAVLDWYIIRKVVGAQAVGNRDLDKESQNKTEILFKKFYQWTS